MPAQMAKKNNTQVIIYTSCLKNWFFVPVPVPLPMPEIKKKSVVD
jgi:hypothetical protein